MWSVKCVLTFVKIGREEKLHPVEIHVILKLNEERYSATKIAKTVNRRRKVDRVN